MAMIPQLKHAWMAALRSGTYRQGYGFLHKDDHYCCLGVLLAVAGRLPQREPGIAPCSALGVLDPWEYVRLNDLQRCDFPTIADYIDIHIQTMEDTDGPIE